MSAEDNDFVVLPESESVEQLVELVEHKFLELLEENLAGAETPLLTGVLPEVLKSDKVVDQAAIARELAPAIEALARLREIAQAIDNTRKVTIH